MAESLLQPKNIVLKSPTDDIFKKLDNSRFSQMIDMHGLCYNNTMYGIIFIYQKSNSPVYFY